MTHKIAPESLFKKAFINIILPAGMAGLIWVVITDWSTVVSASRVLQRNVDSMVFTVMDWLV